MSHHPPTDPPAAAADRAPEWWCDDGHLAEVALSALADGQADVVPEDAASHLAGCLHCQARSGEMVFLGAVADWAVAHPTRAAERSPATVPAAAAPSAVDDAVIVAATGAGVSGHRALVPRARFPRFGLLAALVVAALGALPTAAGLVKSGPLLVVQWRDALMVAMRTVGLVVRRVAVLLGPSADWAPIVGAALLLLIGIGVARGLPRRKGDWA